MAGLAGLYGVGALTIREATVRWTERWASVLFLGAAYALVEEGYALKTMVDPTAPNIGATQAYSYWLGIN